MSTNTNTNTSTSNDSTTTNAPSTGDKKPESIVDAVFDATLAWIDVGLSHAKTSLFGSARAMERTAKALDVVRERLRA